MGIQYCHKSDVPHIMNILKQHNRLASTPKRSRGNIAVHMKIDNESDIPDLVNKLTESCPKDVTITPNPHYRAYMIGESKQKIKKTLSFLVTPSAGYGATLVWYGFLLVITIDIPLQLKHFWMVL